MSTSDVPEIPSSVRVVHATVGKLPGRLPGSPRERACPPGSADDTTRYLCAASYLDPRYSTRAITEFLVEPTRPVPPSPGLDAGRVLTEAVRARARRKNYDGLLVLLMAVVVGPSRDNPLLYGWIVLSVVLVVARAGRAASTTERSFNPRTLALVAVAVVVAWLLLNYADEIFGYGSRSYSSRYADDVDFGDPSSEDGDIARHVIGIVLAAVVLMAVTFERWSLWNLLTTRFKRFAPPAPADDRRAARRRGVLDGEVRRARRRRHHQRHHHRRRQPRPDHADRARLAPAPDDRPPGRSGGLMGHRITNKVSIGGDNSGRITQTGIEGGHADATVSSLLELVERLAADVRGKDLAKQEVLEDTLTDLAGDLRADEAEPAVVRSRWENVKGLLGGVVQFSELVAKISDQVQKIFS